jgi:hypothetical protein
MVLDTVPVNHFARRGLTELHFFSIMKMIIIIISK